VEALLWLVPALPFLGFAVLAVVGRRLPRALATSVGVGSIGLATLVSILIAISYLGSPPAGGTYHQVLWTWIAVGGFQPAVGLVLDPLSLVMILIVTFVGFVIHLYSAEFMAEDEGYTRFFAYMNLFVASMVTLVLADNLLLLYLGWEGVGLCSYLLIGFWYRDLANVRAAQKAFIVTRVGDTAMAVGLFLLFTHLGTLQIHELMQRATQQWPAGSGLAVAAAALLLGGAVGKSAQLPLQTWLPDAMAGPTPTSALIHAATMVTAGVYLVARTHVLYALAPQVQLAVAVVGAATMIVAGFSALVQSDIKRVLAYSTVSQIAYMFLALGVGAWSAGIFHLMTHAFFKALLFLAAGVVIESLHDEHDIFRMGGLRKELPVAFWGFLIGGSALSGLPLVTAGFYSKDLILARSWNFIVFFGEARTPVSRRPGWRMSVAVWTLSFLSIVGGLVNVPPSLGGVPFFTRFLEGVLPSAAERVSGGIAEGASELVAAGAFALGLALAWAFFLRRRGAAEALAANAAGRALHRFWFSDWGMDWLYDHLFVRPVLWLSHVDRHDVVDRVYDGVASVTALGWRALAVTENGKVRWYAAGIAIGTAIFVALVLWP
jgi:NADH-quinone oxidoreductase subunit L